MNKKHDPAVTHRGSAVAVAVDKSKGVTILKNGRLIYWRIF